MDKLIETTFSAALDPASNTPLQEQLYAHLRQAILDGTLGAGLRLPASRSLASLIGVSRNTVLSAYDQLIAEGYLDTRPGAGTFIGAQLPDTYTLAPTSAINKSTDITNEVIEKSQNGPWPGTPALDQFPMQTWARLVSRSWRHISKDILTNSDPAGYQPLRATIAKYLQASRGVQAHADQIIIVSGLQQGLRLVTDCLVPEHARIILENPGFEGMRNVAKQAKQAISYLAVDKDGATVPYDHIKSLLIISPSRQYPLGVTMPASRRLQVLDWASSTDSIIFEDDYDNEFRYAGRPLGAMQGIDKEHRVIYAGSFSKSVFPSLRIGYLVLPERMVEPFLKHRLNVDSFPSIVPQLALHGFISEGHFASHIRKLRKVHARRQAIYRAMFERYLGHMFKLTSADTGLHLVAYPKGRKNIDDKLLAEKARSCGLGADALSLTYLLQPAPTGLLLGFANLLDEHIEPAIKAFSGYIPE